MCILRLCVCIGFGCVKYLKWVRIVTCERTRLQFKLVSVTSIELCVSKSLWLLTKKGLPDSYKLLAEVQHSGMCCACSAFRSIHSLTRSGVSLAQRQLSICPSTVIRDDWRQPHSHMSVDGVIRRCLHHWRWFDSSIGLWSCWRWYNESVRKYGELFSGTVTFPTVIFSVQWERWFYPHQYYMTSASAIAYASPRSMFHCNLFGVSTAGNTVSCSIHECINAAGIMSSSWHLISDVPSTKTIETSMLLLSLTRWWIIVSSSLLLLSVKLSTFISYLRLRALPKIP